MRCGRCAPRGCRCWARSTRPTWSARRGWPRWGGCSATRSGTRRRCWVPSARAAVTAGGEAPEWQAFRAAVGERVIARRDAWKRLRAAVRLRSLLAGRAASAVGRGRRRGDPTGPRGPARRRPGALRDEVTGRGAGAPRGGRVAARAVAVAPGEGGRALRGGAARRGGRAGASVRAARENDSGRASRGGRGARGRGRGRGARGLGAVFTAPVDGVIRAAVSEGVRDALDQALRPSRWVRRAGAPARGSTSGDPWREVSSALDATRSEPTNLPRGDARAWRSTPRSMRDAVR